jgi:acetolactate synthase-1/2/3 large subunit
MGKIRVADYIARKLVAYGVTHVFMVTGGGAMFLNDAFGRCSAMQCVFQHHEQACAIAAEGYARTRNVPVVVNVTTGPGGLNTLTGVMGQWTDSIPVIYISGQVKYETSMISCRETCLRQLGDQEADIISIVKPLTKYAVSLTNPSEVDAELETAIHSATSGRPGPVWIDIPVNVQSALLDEDSIRTSAGPAKVGGNPLSVSNTLHEVGVLLAKAQRPLIVAGHGIRIAGARRTFEECIGMLSMPVVTTFNGFDLLESEHPLFIGRIGTIGDRAGNFALQNADVLLFLGTRNNIRQVSYEWRNFGHKATKIVVDIDASELEKPTIHPDIPVHMEINSFLTLLKSSIPARGLGNAPDEWMRWCIDKKKRYPVVLEGYRNPGKINPYYFIEVLTALLPEGALAVCGNGSACVTMFQAGRVKKNQRIFWNSGCASMGYDLPAAIGACFANNKKDTICIAGDGSLMMNLQELQTVMHHYLPIKLFVLNNKGYQSIKQTQMGFFGPPYIGSTPESGISFPDFCRVAAAFGMAAERIALSTELEEKISKVLAYCGPILCEVVLDTEYYFSPKLASKKLSDGTLVSPPLEDMFPFLSPEEMEKNAID